MVFSGCLNAFDHTSVYIKEKKSNQISFQLLLEVVESGQAKNISYSNTQYETDMKLTNQIVV